MKIIQICGTNGTGKTTLVKNLLKSGRFLKMSIQVDGKNREWWFDGTVAILGKYNDSNCCGIDAGNYSGETLQHAITRILSDYMPNVLLLEDIRYGSTYKFKKNLESKAKMFGYDYFAFALIAKFETVSQRVYNRSKNINVDYDRIRSKARQVVNSCRKLQREGMSIVWVDTDEKDEKGVLSVLRGLIYG